MTKLTQQTKAAALTGAEAISMLLTNRTKKEILRDLDLSDDTLRRHAELLYEAAQ